MTRATISAMRPEAVKRTPAGTPGLVLGGKYRLEEPIARGGMARVWRASHVTLNRPVAVKFIEALGATAEERVDGFLKEAKVAASVRHKNVVDIIDFGVVAKDGDDEPYMVMELLEGQTLDQRLGEGPIEPAEIISIVLQILTGLDAVHRAGIVHRDLKPGNVFLTDDQDGVFARLLDFGISQGAGEAHDAGIVVGTPEYMSPEQAFGDPLDARSDLYSVGVIAYEMLTGIVPFDDPDPQKVVQMVANGTPPPLDVLRPDLPELCAIVARAMSWDPAARYESARAMRRDLAEATGNGPDTTGKHRARRTPDPADSSAALRRISQPTLPLVPAEGTGASDPRRASGERSIRQSVPADEIERAARSSEAPPRTRTRMVTGLVVMMILLAIGAAGWAALGAGSGPEATAAAPVVPPPAVQPPAVPAPAVPETSPTVVTPVAEAEPSVVEVASPAAEIEAAPPVGAPRDVTRPSREPRAARDREAAPEEPAHVRREIVEELDF